MSWVVPDNMNSPNLRMTAMTLIGFEWDKATIFVPQPQTRETKKIVGKELLELQKFSA